jgi:ferric-dicitrate binding protein FerR (iron transport regulator)
MNNTLRCPLVSESRIMGKKYSASDFLNDPQFVRWVRGQEPQASEFWESLMQQHPESRGEMQKAAEIIRGLRLKRNTPSPAIRQEVLNSIVTSIGHQQSAHKKRSAKKSIPAFWRYAAVFVIAAGLSLGLFIDQNPISEEEEQPITSTVIKQTQGGSKLQTQLPDGTRVHLNTSTKLHYYEDLASHTRRVELTGEAFFEVKKDPDRPFIVRSSGVTVTALGTSFNVKTGTAGKQAEIALLTGRVRLEADEQAVAPIELSPGEKAILAANDEKFQTSTLNYTSDIAWKDGVLAFSSANFEEVKQRLESWYGVQIHVDHEEAFAGWSVDGYFENQSLERVLDHLAYSKAFHYSIHNKTVIITKNE